MLLIWVLSPIQLLISSNYQILQKKQTELFKINRIDSVADYFVIYATRNGIKHKIVSHKTDIQLGDRIKVGHSYPIDADFHHLMDPYAVPEYLDVVHVVWINDTTIIDIEPDSEIFDLSYARNLYGLDIVSISIVDALVGKVKSENSLRGIYIDNINGFMMPRPLIDFYYQFTEMSDYQVDSISIEINGGGKYYKNYVSKRAKDGYLYVNSLISNRKTSYWYFSFIYKIDDKVVDSKDMVDNLVDLLRIEIQDVVIDNQKKEVNIITKKTFPLTLTKQL